MLASCGSGVLVTGKLSPTIKAVLEITAGHWPFSNQFQHLADQTPFWSANFTVHFQWDENQ